MQTLHSSPFSSISCPKYNKNQLSVQVTTLKKLFQRSLRKIQEKRNEEIEGNSLEKNFKSILQSVYSILSSLYFTSFNKFFSSVFLEEFFLLNFSNCWIFWRIFDERGRGRGLRVGGFVKFSFMMKGEVKNHKNL